jgi:hypothetical protein
MLGLCGEDRTRALTDNPDELRTMVAALQAELYAKTLHIEKLKSQLVALRRARFGRSSERLDREIEQLELLIGEIEEGRAARPGTDAAGKPAAGAPSRQQRM